MSEAALGDEMMSAVCILHQLGYLDETIEIDICGNTLTGNPRTFSSDNCGWYLGGKIEVRYRPAALPLVPVYVRGQAPLDEVLDWLDGHLAPATSSKMCVCIMSPD